MKRLIWATASVAVLGLAACDQAADTPTVENPEITSASTGDVDTDIAAFQDLLGTDFVQVGASEADMNGLLEAMPAYAGLDWETMRFDADTGATVFTGLALSLGAEDPMGIRFEEASVWGLDSEFLAARLKGERLDESGPLLTRFDGNAFSYFGIDALFNNTVNGFLAMVDEDGEMPEGFNLSIDAFEYTGGRFLVTDVSLSPWEFSALDAGILPEELDEEPAVKDLVVTAIHFGQQLIAGSRSIAYDKAVVTDLTGTMSMRQPGANVEFATKIEFYGVSGVDGFDLDQSVARNVTTVQTTEYVELDFGDDEFGQMSPMGMPAGTTVSQETSYAKAKSSDLRLNKVMGFLARSELPRMDERDLLSLGTSSITDFEVSLNGEDAFAAKRIDVRADQFDWLIPSDVEISFDDGAVNLSELTVFTKGIMEGFANTAEETMSETEAAELALVLEGIDKGVALLPEHGLDKIVMDGSFTAKWDADQGPADFGYRTESAGFGDSEGSVGLTFPIYETLKAASESDDFEGAFEAAFEEAFAIRSVRFFEADKGGYDKILGFVQAIGAEYPDQGWGAMVSNMDPPQMRSYAATIMRMGRAGAEEEFPPAVAWLDAIAAYVESGGSIELAMRPPTPITPDTFDELDETDDPQIVVDRLGISVVHTPK